MVARQLRPALVASIPWLDLLVIGSLYAMGTEPAGVTFTLFVLALLSAAVLLPSRRAALYTLLTMVVVALLAPTLANWSTDPRTLNVFAARLLILPLVGGGATLLIQRFAQARAETQMYQHEAERLVELEKLRSEFVASVSHDLHTPLTAIITGLGLLDASAEQQLRDDQLRLLHHARQNGERLRHLIDDLLTYNRLTAGVLSLQREVFDLRELAIAAITAVQAMLERKGQLLALDLPSPLLVYGDQHQLERVLINLVYNAHIHTPPGTRIAITGKAAESEIHVMVHDTGPGIPPDAHGSIFEPFHRRGTPGSGSGLGLAIAKRLIEMHDGCIWVENTFDKGTAFHIVLPQHPTAEPTVPTDE
jgi:signal transduction histidine kinase